MLIVETPVVAKRVLDILTDDEYRDLQHFLSRYPDAGDVIAGSHGLRKLRWTISSRVKRGGTRIICFWLKARDTRLMLVAFRKNERGDLSKHQLKILKSIAAKEIR